MYNRSNMFANIECKYKYATEEEILDSIPRSGQGILQSGLDLEMLGNVLQMCTHFGLGGKGKLSDKQKKAVDIFLGTFLASGSVDDMYDDLSCDIDEGHYNLISALAQLDPQSAMAVLHYILALVYIDGTLDDEKAEFLDRTFGQALLMNFLQSGEEEVPGPFVSLSGLEADIAKYFDENDPLLSLDQICELFPDADRDDVEESLENLLQEEILYKADTAIGSMYARFN